MAKAKTKPAEHTSDLPERIAAAEQAIAALRDERAQAMLEGKDFDSARLSAAEAELEALEDAQAAQHRQAQKAAQEATAEAAETLRKEVLDLEAKRIGHVEQAEAHARAMVAELHEAEACRAEIEARFRRMGVGWAPGRNDQAVRLARALCAVLTPLAGKGGVGTRWGDLTLRRGFIAPSDAWAKHEESVGARMRTTLEAENG